MSVSRLVRGGGGSEGSSTTPSLLGSARDRVKMSKMQEVKCRGAPDSGFRYPAGYRIGRIVPSYPAG